MLPTYDSLRMSRLTRTWLIAFTAWSLFGYAQIILASLVVGRWNDVYVGRSAFQFMPRVWIWALATPLIAAVDFHARRHSSSIARRIAWHLPVFAIICFVQAALRRATLSVLTPMPNTVPFWVTYLYYADIEAVRYVASLTLGRVLEAARELVQKERREARLKEEIAKAQLHYLDLQLQPHFMFNALGSIAELAHEAPAAAGRMVEHLTSLLRYATQPRTGQEVTLREELAQLTPYLEIQRMRFPDWLTISQNISPEAEDAMIPRMLLQPLVENAIRHGLSHRRSGGRIEFGASVHGDDLVLSVYDNGVGFTSASKSPGLGIGLGNIRDRLSTLYGESQSLELLTHKEGGVEVVVRMPFRRAPLTTTAAEASDDLARRTALPAEPPLPRRKSTDPKRLIKNWIAAGSVLTLYSLFYVTIRHPPGQTPPLEVVQQHIVNVVLWLALTPAAVFLSRRFPVSREKMAESLPVHLLAGSVISFAHWIGWRTIMGDWSERGFEGGLDSIFWNLTVYWVLVAVAQRDVIEDWIRQRDVAAAKMRAELTTARLSTVMLELRPDFLLSSLASLRALVLCDAAKAEKLLTTLADFLRLTLESLTKPTVSVEREIALLEAYANVHRAGAGDFPELLLEFPKPVEGEVVPTGVTRIMTERLLESGNKPECIIVSIKRTDAGLTIRVAPADVSKTSEFLRAPQTRDPFGRLARLTDSGAVVRFAEDTLSLEVDLPRKRGNSHAAQKPGTLVLQYG